MIGWPDDPSSEATLEVFPTPLAAEIGFPLQPGQPPARSSFIDIADGDTEDRFRGCREPCVQSTPGQDDGTGSKPADCLDPDEPILESVLTGLTLRAGQPLLKPGQPNVCVPEEQLHATAGRRVDVADACGSQNQFVRDPLSDAPLIPAWMQLGRGSPGSYPSRVTQWATRPGGPGTTPCSAGEHEIDVGRTRDGSSLLACVTCDRPSDRVAGAFVPVPAAGQIRRCDSHDDCTLHTGTRAGFQPGDYLCTHLNVAFDGISAGEGLCARPELCANPAVPGCNQVTLHNGSDFDNTVNVVAGPLADDPDEDFTPALPNTPGETDAHGFECQLVGCARCTGESPAGQTSANRYCFDDSDCPAHHDCLTPDEAQQTPSAGTPMCVARPLLNDERLDDLLRGLDSAGGTVSLPSLNLGQILGSALTGTSVPIQTAAGPALVDSLEARVADATVRWIPDPVPAFKGAGVLRVDLDMEDEQIRIGGKVRPDLPRDRAFRVRVKVGTIRLELRPKVNHHTTHNELRLRALPPLLLDRGGDLIGGGDIDVLEPKVPLELFLPGLWKVIGALLGFSEAVLESFINIDRQDLADLPVLGGLDQGLAALIRPILDEAFVGGLLFGVPEAQTDPLRLEPAPTLEAAASAGGALDLRYRGERVNFTEVVPGAMELLDTDTFCCGLSEPSPRCLEAALGPDSSCSQGACPATPFSQCVNWEAACLP